MAVGEYLTLTAMNPADKNKRLIYPKYHFRLAELYEEKGETTKAIERYERFLKIWENADKRLPELIEAKARIAKLRSVDNGG